MGSELEGWRGLNIGRMGGLKIRGNRKEVKGRENKRDLPRLIACATLKRRAATKRIFCSAMAG